MSTVTIKLDPAKIFEDVIFEAINIWVEKEDPTALHRFSVGRSSFDYAYGSETGVQYDDEFDYDSPELTIEIPKAELPFYDASNDYELLTTDDVVKRVSYVVGYYESFELYDIGKYFFKLKLKGKYDIKGNICLNGNIGRYGDIYQSGYEKIVFKLWFEPIF